MLKSILVASDLSSRSKFAVQRAVQLAEGSGAVLCILHVVEDNLPEEGSRQEIQAAEDYLKDQAAGFGKPPACHVTVATGRAFQVIEEEASAREADLIVMGAHRRRPLRDLFVGTTGERVIRTARRPVLMANSKTGERWRKVFIATDMSEASGQAARRAHALGMLENAHVTFVHGYAPITRQMMIHAGIPAERIHEEAERELQSKRGELGQFIEGLNLRGLKYNTRIIEGVGADAIIECVEQAKPDLLVIGTRGLSGVKRLFLGSVAQQLMGCVEVDVLAVPPQA